MDRMINTEGCSGCHAGRGVSGGGLLKASREQLCYRCHGSASVGKGRAAADIQSVMQKTYRHPVEETSYLHWGGEVLPAESTGEQRHVACSDCHLSHVTSPAKPWNGAPGYRPGPVRGQGKGAVPMGRRLNRADSEYELCYRCHSEGVDLGFDARDISAEFDSTNASYHPVEMSGRNNNVPSLVKELNEASVIKCTSCHGNSDPTGPAGPHGSDYKAMLVAEYQMVSGPESIMSYALCYICHDRTSILSDESFKAHRSHVALHNVSCKGCHNAHGSRDNSNLVEFDSTGMGVTNASDGSGPLYLPGTPGMPKCFLNCHGTDHNTNDINGKPWIW